MKRTGESLREVSQSVCLLSMKAKTRIGTWNVRTMYEAGKAAQVAKEMGNYGMEVLGICESRWNGCGVFRLSTGESVIYSGHPNDAHDHTEQWSSHRDVTNSSQGSLAVGTNLLQDNDS